MRNTSADVFRSQKSALATEWKAIVKDETVNTVTVIFF